jgi:hypothetical protein
MIKGKINSKSPSSPKSPRSPKKQKDIDGSKATELTPLNNEVPSHDVLHNSEDLEVDHDFLFVANEELHKVNKFFIGELAELQFKLSGITERRKNAYRTHHTAAMPSDLNSIRDIYMQLKHLRSFCDINNTGKS